MVVFTLGNILEQIDKNQITGDESSLVIIADSADAADAMKLTGMVYEGEVNLRAVSFTKIEEQQECISGSICIPKLLDILGSRHRIQFFINQRHIVIVDDNDFTIQLVERIRKSKTKQGNTKEQFLYNFITQIMSRDLEILGKYENHIMKMEENVSNGRTRMFQSEITPLRRELLTLRGYYEEIMDMGKHLEANENGFFNKKQLNSFQIISEQASRLMGRTAHLLEYAQQVRDAYQTQVDGEQSKNMQLLTVISTIFFPLTLITGWFGMNFENMPFLRQGYPFVVILSIIVLIFCVIFFKKKHML